jgi:NAD-dependent dihydropyrimidine dehydrogenase PreA subunit
MSAMDDVRADADSPPCKHPAGAFHPVIDPNRCEGKAACVAECPYDVFVVRRRERGELPGLSLLGTVKWWAHGGLQAEAVRADQCHGCGLCVNACPESAIKLARVGQPGTGAA